MGIVAPARKITPEEIDGFFTLMRAWGFRVKKGEHLFDEDHQFAGKDPVRKADLQQMLDDPEVKAVFFARGGYGTVRTVDGLDLTLLRKNPKWLIGFSDLTVIHAMVNRMAGVQTLHAEMPVNYTGDKEREESIDSIRKSLSGENPVYRIPAHTYNILGKTSGILTGGNLSVLYSLRGTPIDLEPEGKILFIEDLDEYLYHIDRMMMNFKIGGVLQKVRGIIIGYMNDMHDNEVPFGKDAYGIIREHVEKLKVPVCFGFPAGHQKKNLALVMGAEVALEVGKDKIMIKIKD
ncbi:MAG: LD-carboxypeptidase [Nitrospiraceae bacterium]|nr:LD-carboxypeptidase [Nitrospiraceae bacterium]